MHQIRKAVGSAIIDPRLLTYVEQLQYEGYLRRLQTNEAILELSKQNVPIKQIVKRTGHSRKLVRGVLRGQRSDVFCSAPDKVRWRNRYRGSTAAGS